MSVAMTAAPAAAASRQPQPPIRVMVVDDSVVVRGLVSRWIEEQPGLELAASLRTGRDAVTQLERANPDVVVLDIEMPDLDGISALPLLLEKKRDLIVIMASTLTRRNAEVSLKALSLGAADYIPKPETNRGVTTSRCGGTCSRCGAICCARDGRCSAMPIDISAAMTTRALVIGVASPAGLSS